VTRRAHRSPRPTFRDGRHAPLAGTGYTLKAGDLRRDKTEIFFLKGLDRQSKSALSVG
jgi:hypothetical protein